MILELIFEEEEEEMVLEEDEEMVLEEELCFHDAEAGF